MGTCFPGGVTETLTAGQILPPCARAPRRQLQAFEWESFF
jgi:hypothetical protein